MPAVASAEEIHLDTSTFFTGTAGGSSLTIPVEPVWTFESIDITNGTISAGGTTGTLTLDFTGCHTTVFGLTAKCHTAGSPVDNTFFVRAPFHLITWKNSAGTAFPAILLTVETFETINAGTSTLHFEGNLIGTITSPACNAVSKGLTLSFTATGATQNHIAYTGKTYDLVARTGGGTGEPKTAGFNASATITTNTAGALTCT